MLLRQAIELLIPPQCEGCGAERTRLCQACRAKLVTRTSICYHCNRVTVDWRSCPTCRRHAPLARVTVATYYEGPVKALVWAAKFRHDQAAAEALAELLSPTLAPERYDLVTAVPAAPSRLRLRGYNQAEVMARRLARDLGLPYHSVLARRSGQPQVGADRQRRLEQVRDKMFGHRPSVVAGRRVLVIDDVLTTGATLGEAARALKSAGARTIEAAAVAKH